MPPSTAAFPLFVRHELAFRTQYAELKERSRATVHLLPGTPGTLVLRSASGRPYWYRVYQTASGKQAEAFVGPEGDAARLEQARADVAFAQWARDQIRSLRKLDYQVADKAAAQVLVEFHNAGLLRAGLCVVGTLAYMAWLNELGARAVAARTQDIDLAAPATLELAVPSSLARVIDATRLGFHAVPELNPRTPPSSLKLPGAQGLRVDVLTHGKRTGDTVALPALQWHAQTVPHYDYLLHAAREAAVLAGGHCIPVRLPEPERFVWHKLYSSAARRNAPEKAAKDLRQAVTLASVLADDDADVLLDSFDDVPAPMKTTLARQRTKILASLPPGSAARALLEGVLGLQPRRR
jgi:hypothetical protein